MSYQITIQPSGHTCSAKAYETVLESAIEAALIFRMAAGTVLAAAAKARF